MATKKTKPAVGRSHVFDALSKMDVGRAFGVSTRSVSRWYDDGCPRNDDGTYALKDVIAWYVDRASANGGGGADAGDLKNKKLEGEIELQRLKIADLERKMVLRARVESVLVSMCTSFRNYWERRWQHNTPKLLGALGVGADRSAQVRDVVQSMIKESMESMLSDAQELSWDDVDVPTTL